MRFARSQNLLLVVDIVSLENFACWDQHHMLEVVVLEEQDNLGYLCRPITVTIIIYAINIMYNRNIKA